MPDFARFVKPFEGRNDVRYPSPYGLLRLPPFRLRIGHINVYLPKDHQAFIEHLNQAQPKTPKAFTEAEATFINPNSNRS